MAENGKGKDEDKEADMDKPKKRYKWLPENACARMAEPRWWTWCHATRAVLAALKPVRGKDDGPGAVDLDGLDDGTLLYTIRSSSPWGLPAHVDLHGHELKRLYYSLYMNDNILDFYFSFLRKVGDRFRDPELDDDAELAACERCGSPSSTDLCAFCRLIDRATAQPVELGDSRRRERTEDPR